MRETQRFADAARLMRPRAPPCAQGGLDEVGVARPRPDGASFFAAMRFIDRLVATARTPRPCPAPAPTPALAPAPAPTPAPTPAPAHCALASSSPRPVPLSLKSARAGQAPRGARERDRLRARAQAPAEVGGAVLAALDARLLREAVPERLARGSEAEHVAVRCPAAMRPE
jgi:hypothetical protein